MERDRLQADAVEIVDRREATGLGFVARRLVGLGRVGGERVRAAVNVRAFMGVERRQPVDDRLRFLRRCAVVEPDQTRLRAVINQP
jgi:hypothetical protein